MPSAIERLQSQARAAPAWLRVGAIAGSFVVPVIWVVGDDNIFDVVLGLVTRLAGPGADFRHLLAYLICVLVLLVPAGVLLQFVGRARLRRAQERAPQQR